jgi:hypothetical protein
MNSDETPQSESSRAYYFPEFRAAMRHWVDDAAAVIADRLAGAAGGEPLLEAINTAQDVVYTTPRWNDVRTCIS